ncbi:MAG: MATE family efflux transporter [Eubacteriales bacterium]|nr:MATE family efflux transporter [Eubacteriales bacterium]
MYKTDSIKQTQPDLGSGNVGQLVIKLAVPAIISQLVNLLYNIVDRIYIGHMPGDGAIALTGLGLCLPVIMLITAFSMLVGAGGAPNASIAMGKGDIDTAETILGNCFAMLVMCAVLLTAFVEISARPLLVCFGASPDTLPYALSYIRIYSAGTLFVMLALGLNTFITTQGAASTAMKTVVIGAVINIILDPIFIFIFDMGVRGAALATIISQGISAAWVMRFLTGNKTRLHIRKNNLRLRKEIVMTVLALGIAPFIMTSTESILNVAFNSSLSRYGGDIAVGSMTILSSVMQLQMLPVQGLAQGAQPVMSFNYGAGKTDRVMSAFRILAGSCIAYTLLFWLAVQTFPEVFVRIFNSSSEELITCASWALRIYMGGTAIFGLQMAVQQTFVSLGQAKLSLFVACLRKIILLIPLIYILPMLPAFSGDMLIGSGAAVLSVSGKVLAVFLAEPAADIISVTVCGLLFLFTYKRILSGAKLQASISSHSG